MIDVKLFERGKAAFITDKYLEAIKLFSQAIKIKNSNPDYFYWRGLARQALKQHQDAIQDYDQVTKLNPSHAEAFYKRGISRYFLEHSYGALANFTKAIELGANHADVHYHLGKVNEELKNNDKAIADYTAAIQIDENNINAYEARASLYMQLGCYQEAIADYDRIQKVKPKCTNCFFRRAKAKKALGQYQQAIIDYEEVTRLNPQNGESYFQLGLCWNELEQFAKASSHYDTAIKLGINTAEIYCKRGLTRKAQCQYQLAIDDFTQALKIKPEFASALLYRGNVKKILRQYEEAVKDYNEANRLNPNNPDTLMQRGIVHYHLHNYELALKDLDDAILSKCRCLITKYYHGKTQYALGKLPEAIADYTQILQSNDKYINALFRRGIVWNVLKEYHKALKDYDCILQIDSSHVKAKHQREIALTAIKQTETQPLPDASRFSAVNCENPESKNTERNMDEKKHEHEIFLEGELRKQILRVNELEDKLQQQAKQMEELSKKVSDLIQKNTAPSHTIYHPVSHPSIFCAKLIPHAIPSSVRLPYHVFNLLITLNNAGYYAYWVGGGVRNLLLGYDFVDLDIITNASDKLLSAIFPELRQNPFISCYYKVKMDGIDIDITACDTQTFLSIADIAQDAVKRDFTINALYCDVYGNIYDPLKQGIEDLQHFYTIRVIGDPLQRFNNDPLLLLRAARLVSHYQFNLPEELKTIIYQTTHLVAKIDKVRLQVELKRHFVRGFAVKSLETLLELNLFNAIFPKTQKLLEIEAGNEYKKWLWQQLVTTDYFVTNQQPVSMNYVYALFLTGTVLFELYQTKHMPSNLETVISSSIREIDIFDTGNNYMGDMERLISDFTKKLLSSLTEPTKPSVNGQINLPSTKPQLGFWSNSHSSPQKYLQPEYVAKSSLRKVDDSVNANTSITQLVNDEHIKPSSDSNISDDKHLKYQMPK